MTTTLIVVAFNVIMLTLLEVPLLGYAFAPDRTASAVQRFSLFLHRDGGRIALIGAIVVGVALVALGGAHMQT